MLIDKELSNDHLATKKRYCGVQLKRDANVWCLVAIPLVNFT